MSPSFQGCRIKLIFILPAYRRRRGGVALAAADIRRVNLGATTEASYIIPFRLECQEPEQEPHPH